MGKRDHFASREKVPFSKLCVPQIEFTTKDWWCCCVVGERYLLNDYCSFFKILAWFVWPAAPFCLSCQSQRNLTKYCFCNTTIFKPKVQQVCNSSKGAKAQSIGGSLLDGSRSFQFSFGGKGSQIPIRSLQIASELDHISDLDQFTSSITFFNNSYVKTE